MKVSSLIPLYTFICVKWILVVTKRLLSFRRKKIPRGIARAEKRKRQGKAIGDVRDAWSQFFASMNKLIIQIIPRTFISRRHREIIDYLMESRFRDREPYVKIRTFHICPFKAMHQKLWRIMNGDVKRVQKIRTMRIVRIT